MKGDWRPVSISNLTIPLDVTTIKDCHRDWEAVQPREAHTDAGAAGSGSPARTYKLSDSLLPILLNAYKEKPNRFFDNTKTRQ